MKLLETNLNLRIERKKKKEDYYLSPAVANKQLAFGADIYANVEFMDCINLEYLESFQKAGYKAYTVLDKDGRGILCEVKNNYAVEIIQTMTSPHMMHLHIQGDNGTRIDLITMRILVSDEDKMLDYKDRRQQWKDIMKYIASLPDKAHLILTGDFNHGVIADHIASYTSRPREFYNYQIVHSDIQAHGMVLCPIDGMSYKGYMKIDHLITGNKIVIDHAVYKELFTGKKIGIPDHKSIFADFRIS